MILIFGDNTFNKVKTKTEQPIFYVDRKNKGSTVYFSLEKFLLDHQLGSEDTIISFEGKSPLAFRLQFPNAPRGTPLLTTENYNIDQILDNKELKKEDYDIFSGSLVEAKDKTLILENIKLLSEIAYQMLEAGYMDLENNKKVDDWIVSFQEPLLQLFVNYTKIETSNPTFTVEDEFLDNPVYRKTILLGMLRVLSNFIINNNYITIEEVSKLGTWTNFDTWKKIKEKVKIL
jgi:hypothetical protein